MIFYLENVIFARLDVDIKVSGVTANLVCRHQRLLEVGGVVPPAKYVLSLSLSCSKIIKYSLLDLEVVHTFEVLHLSPAEANSAT